MGVEIQSQKIRTLILNLAQELRTTFGKMPNKVVVTSEATETRYVNGSTVDLGSKPLVLKVGVTETRYVGLKHCRPWVIHAYRNIKGRGFHKEEETEGSNALNEGNSSKRIKLQDNVLASMAAEQGEGTDETTLSDPSRLQQNLPLEDIDSTNASNNIVQDTTNIVEDTTEPNKVPFQRSLSEEIELDEVQKKEVERPLENKSVEKSSVKNSGEAQTDSVIVPVEKISSEDYKKLQKSDIAIGEDAEVETQPGRSHSDKTIAGQSDTPRQADQGLPDRSQSSPCLSVASEMMKGTTLEETSRSGTTRADKKRKAPVGEEEGPSTTEPEVKSSYDKVRLICQPWRKPEGGVNKPVLKMMMESVMLFLMLKPGSSLTALYNRYGPYIQPMVLKNIVEILKDIGCVTQQYIRPAKVSLFSKPFQSSVANEDSGDCQVLLLPTEECIYRLGQFGLEIYPGVEWPKLEEFS